MFETTNQYLAISAVHRESQTFISVQVTSFQNQILLVTSVHPVLPIIGGIKTEAQKENGDSHALSIKSSFQCINPPKKYGGSKSRYLSVDDIHDWYPNTW